MTRYKSLLLLSLILIPSSAWPGEPAANRIKVSDPYVKAVPPGAANTAAFMELRNSGDSDIMLTEISTPVAKAAEVHLSVHEKGVMKMSYIKSLKLEGNKTTTLKHDGYHIMLIGLKKTLKAGDTVPLTLTFNDGSSIVVNAPVRKGMMEMKHKNK